MERGTVMVGVSHEGEGLIDPRAVDEGVGLAVRSPREARDEVLLVVEEAGDRPGDVLLNASA